MSPVKLQQDSVRDIDVLTVQEDNRAGISDPEVLDRASELKRVLFSRDDDLLAIANQRQQQGQFFMGSFIPIHNVAA